jgi:hypothetical protein
MRYSTRYAYRFWQGSSTDILLTHPETKENKKPKEFI